MVNILMSNDNLEIHVEYYGKYKDNNYLKLSQDIYEKLEYDIFKIPEILAIKIKMFAKQSQIKNTIKIKIDDLLNPKFIDGLCYIKLN